MSIIKEIEKAEKWLSDNEQSLKSLGENGEKVFESLKGMLTSGSTTVISHITGYSDVDSILSQAASVDAVIKAKGIDIESLFETAITVIRSALLIGALL